MALVLNRSTLSVPREPPRPSQLGRLQELIHVWVGGVRCAAAGWHSGDSVSEYVCTPVQALVPGLARVLARYPDGSWSSSGGAVEGLQEAGLDPCSVQIQQVAKFDYLPGMNDGYSIPCVAVGMMGAIRLRNSGAWGSAVPGGDTAILELFGAGWSTTNHSDSSWPDSRIVGRPMSVSLPWSHVESESDLVTESTQRM